MATTAHGDDENMTVRYVKFSHGCLLMDCVEDDLRKVAKVSDLLSFYGLYRQAMCGDNTQPQPSYIYAESRLKWNAWSKYKGMSKKDALSKWEQKYNHFVSSFPEIFKEYNADLTQYDPFKYQTEKIKKLESQLALISDQKSKGNVNGKVNGNGIQYVTLQRDQYQTIIDRMNQFKNKMQEYHQQFQHNAKQIQSLKEENNMLKANALKTNVLKTDLEAQKQGNRNGSKSKRFFLFMCLMLIVGPGGFVAILYFYKKRKNRLSF